MILGEVITTMTHVAETDMVAYLGSAQTMAVWKRRIYTTETVYTIYKRLVQYKLSASR